MCTAINIMPTTSTSKWEALFKRMLSLDIKEEDLIEQFIKGSGKGGQKRNKVSSAVTILHQPSGIRIRCEKERSQSINRYHARHQLCDRVEQIRTGKILEKDRAISKIRRQKAKRSKKAKLKILAEKSLTSKRKKLRSKVSED